MKTLALNCNSLLVVAGVGLLCALITAGPVPGKPQASIDNLKATLNSQYARIEHTIREPPSIRQYPVQSDYRRHLREWQDDLAQAFAAAADTVKQILKRNPPNINYWQDRLEALQLYSQPVSTPEERKVFGASEMSQSARITNAPAADYTDEARVAKVRGEVRLRLVLASDGTVKNIFPIKSLPHGLADAAMAAARRIQFERAIRNGKPASQFVTLVYEFKDGQGRPPYIPKTEF
jgi:TonB family protein